MECIEDKSEKVNCPKYLTCEHRMIYFFLMTSAGMMGAYTINARGGVFCNAQTANIVMMSIEIGKGQIRAGLYYLIPILAYCTGAFVSEMLPSPLKRFHFLRWDTWLVGLEMLVLLFVGFMPLTVSDRIIQVIINFIASMQYNTFRQAEEVPMATTFCTNHIRQMGVALAKAVRKHSTAPFRRILIHLEMITGFFGGGIIVTMICSFAPGQAIWVALIPLGIVFCRFVYADLRSERDLLERKPAGH